MSKTTTQQHSHKQPRHAAADHDHTMPNGGDVRIKTNSGTSSSSKCETFIASTQRADGSWRKPRRVKAGYVPQDEQPRFECRAQVEQRQRSGGGGTDANSSSSKLPLGWDPVEMVKGVGGTLKQKQQTKTPSASAGGIVPPLLLPPFCPVASVERPQAPITPGDHLRKQMAKLEKKLDEIDKLKQKIDSGELAKPEQTQLDKLARRAEVEREVEQLSEQLANL